MAQWLQACGIRTVVMQATGVYWVALFQILEDYGLEVNVVNARHTSRSEQLRTHIIDLVITDIFMPDADGFELICDLHRERPDIEVIAISGRDTKRLQDAKLLGARVVLREPMTVGQIRERVSELLHDRKPS